MYTIYVKNTAQNNRDQTFQGRTKSIAMTAFKSDPYLTGEKFTIVEHTENSSTYTYRREVLL